MSWQSQDVPCEKSKKIHLPWEDLALDDLAHAIEQQNVGLPAVFRTRIWLTGLPVSRSLR